MRLVSYSTSTSTSTLCALALAGCGSRSELGSDDAFMATATVSGSSAGSGGSLAALICTLQQ